MAGPRHLGAPGSLIIWHTLKPIFFKVSSLGHGWRVSKFRIIFGEILTRVKPRVCQHYTSDYSSDILVALTDWRPGQLPGWTAP